MRGKIGLVVGLAAGYVLGARAGRKRYEQIKAQWMKVWRLDPVQEQVNRVKDFAKEQAMGVPVAIWQGAVSVARSASRAGTPGQKLDAVLATGKDAAADVADTIEDAVEDAAKAMKKSAQRGN